MFDSVKENKPLSGGYSAYAKRVIYRNRTIFMGFALFGLFIFMMIHLSRDSEHSQRHASFDANEPKLEEFRDDIDRKGNELGRREQDIRKRELELEKREKELYEKERGKNDVSNDLIDDYTKKDGEDNKERDLRKSKSGADEKRQAAVKEAMEFAWNGYVSKAWGEDELRPVDGTTQNWLGLGLTILDSLDTLWIMDMKDDFNKCRDWIRENLRFDQTDKDVSFFETTIRVLGGLLSAYELSGDELFLQKADDLGGILIAAFDTPSGIPYTTINLKTKSARNPSWNGNLGVLAEAGTVQLEFNYLAKHTGKSIYAEKANRVYHQLNKMEKKNGLYSIYIQSRSDPPTFSRTHVTLGAMGDSYYEYLLKLWILTGKKEKKWRKMYDEAMDAVDKQLIKLSDPNKLVYIAEYIGDRYNHKMDHLVCFAGGMYALGAQGFTEKRHKELGAEITRTCHEFYARTETGISAELYHFGPPDDFRVPGDAKHYLLRPETAESFFVLWRMTHDSIYREWGWEAFQAINKHCKTKYGYSGIRDVTSKDVVHDNLQQSFFLAETLKYFYLLFSDDSVIPLDKYVFNTEAHPLGIYKD